MAEISKTIQNFVSNHSSDTTTPLNKWETLKCVVWGILIQHSFRLKKFIADDIRHLLSTIVELDPHHKRDLDPTIFVKLSNACHDLLQLLDSHSLNARDRARNFHYSLANK